MIPLLITVNILSLSAAGKLVILPFFDDLGSTYFYNDESIINLPSPIILGTTTANTTSIHSNGFLSFGQEKFNVNTTRMFPLDSASVKIVAPFWDTIDYSLAGQIKYSLVSNQSKTQQYLIDDVNLFLAKSQKSAYNAKWIFAVQWMDICPFGVDICKQDVNQRNTFQAVIAANDIASLVIFTYQCGKLNQESDYGSAIVGYSISDKLYRQYPLNNLTELACMNLPYSNFTNLVYQLNYGVPLITAGPTDMIGQVGQSVEFQCIAQAVPQIEIVKWRKNGVLIEATSSHIISIEHDGDVVRSVLTVNDLSMFDDGNAYQCTVTNTEGTIESDSGILTVNQPAVISTFPASITQKENTQALLTCIAIGHPLPTIIWNGPNGQLFNSDSHIAINTFSQTPTSTVSILVFPSLSFSDSGSYNCTAKNLAHGVNNSFDEDVQTFAITVQTAPVLEYSSPAISDGIVLILGDTLIIEFIITKAEPPITTTGIEWTFSKDLHSPAYLVCESELTECVLFGNRVSLVIANVSTINEGLYRIQVSNNLGMASKALSVSVKDYARIRSLSTSYVLNETDQLVLHCVATGIPQPNITWTKKMSPYPLFDPEPSSNKLPSEYSIITSEPIQESNGVFRVVSTILVPSVNYTDRGSYVCTAVNKLADGILLSDDAASFALTVQTPPKIIPQSNIFMGTVGRSINMSVTISRDNPIVQPSDTTWTLDRTTIGTTNDRYSFSNDQKILTISNITYEDGGVYRVTSSNAAGQSSAEITLYILDYVRIHSLSTSYVLNETDQLVLHCVATGIPPPNITWTKQMSPYPLFDPEPSSNKLPSEYSITTSEPIQESNGVYRVVSTILVPSVNYTDRGSYVCTAVNKLADGILFSDDVALFAITVQTFPMIVPHLSIITGIVGQSINMGVAISRDNPIVQPSDTTWTLDSTTLGTTNDRYSFSNDRKTLTISNITYEDGGVYRVTSSNAAGQSSAEITLDILAPPSISAPTSHVTVNESSTAILNCIGKGHPLPDIYWMRLDGKELPQGWKIVTKTVNNVALMDQYIQSLLSLSNISSSENGVMYECIGINNVTNLVSAPESASILLTVQVHPVIDVIGPSTITHVIHRGATGLLDATVNFKISYELLQEFEWNFISSVNGSEIISIINSSRYILHHSYQKASLTIRDVHLFDQGWYSLTIKTGAGIAQSSIKLLVNAETDISLISNDSKIIQVDEHESAGFTCIADGVPRPRSIIWFRNATLIDPSLFKKVNITQMEVRGFRDDSYLGIKSILTIQDVSPRSDNGLYTCRSSNGVGQPALLDDPYQLLIAEAPSLNLCALKQPCANGGTCVDAESSYYCICTFDYTGFDCKKDVVIEIPPKITSPPQNATADLYGYHSLICEVSGTPKPRITWYKDGEMVDDGDSNINEFTINEVGLGDRGFYHCEAISRINGEIITVVSDAAVINIKGVVQYSARLIIQQNVSGTVKLSSIQELIDEVNEFVAGSIIQGDSSLFFIELHDTNKTQLTYEDIPIIITIINSEGGSDELLLAVQNGLSDISIGLEIDLSFLVTDRHDGCQSETTVIHSVPADPLLDILIEWPEINIGEEAIVKCPCGEGVDLGSTGSLEARRYCGGTFTQGAQWEEEFVAPCNFSNQAREICNLALLPSSDRILKLGNITDTALDPTEISVASSVLLTTRDEVSGNTNLTESFLEVVDNIIIMPEKILRESVQQANISARLLESVEFLVENLHISETESRMIISKRTFSITLEAVNANSTNKGSMYKYSENGSSIFLPQELLELTQNNGTALPVAIYSVYRSPGLFLQRKNPYSHRYLRINSDVISASINRTNIEGLTNPVVITINTKANDSDKQSCYFWKSSLDSGFGGWSQEGCTSNYTSDGQLVCRCNHLTNFAVLLDASPEPAKPIDSVVGQALNAISYIGVIISIVCLLVTIVTYLGSRKLRRSEHGRMLLNLCFSLLGLYLSFILALHGTTVPAFCAVVSIFLQYFLLVTFFVMASEALNLYMKLVIVLGKGISQYFLKATLTSWIVPIFIVIFCFAPNYKFYIMDHFCRVFDVPFYIGVLVPFIIIYIFNWTLFIIIMVQLLKRQFLAKYKESVSNKQKMSFKQQFVIALTLSLLFGLGWGVGLLATQSLYTVTAIRDLFSALFILLTSFQGLFIFLMHCVRSREARQEWTKWVYKAAGKEFISVSSNFPSSSLRRSTLKKQNCITTTETNLNRFDTLKKYVSKSFDEDVITGHELDKLGNLEQGPEVANKLTSSTNAVSSSPSEKDHGTFYPVPSDIRFSKAFAPDFHSSSPTSSIGSGLCRSYENPFQDNSDHQMQISNSCLSLSSESKQSHEISCSNLPNPIEDHLSGVFHY